MWPNTMLTFAQYYYIVQSFSVSLYFNPHCRTVILIIFNSNTYLVDYFCLLRTLHFFLLDCCIFYRNNFSCLPQTSWILIVSCNRLVIPPALCSLQIQYALYFILNVMNEYTDWDRSPQICSFHPSVWFICLVSPSTVGNYSECGFLRLYLEWQFLKSYQTQAIWYVPLFLNIQSMLSGDEWKLHCYDKICSWQILVGCYSCLCFLLGAHKQNAWVFSSRSSPAWKSIGFFYLKKENREWKHCKINL